MPSAESTAQPALLLVHTGQTSHAIEPGRGSVTIGREPQAGVQIDDPQISQEYLRAESTDGQWRIVDNSPSGMFVDGLRQTSVTVTGKTIVRFGDPTAGKVLTFEVVRSSESPRDPGIDEPDPGMLRAGAAAAARRRELDISQRSLAAGGIINAGALIAFEKGRSWPRERTRAKLEEILQWPPGTIARIRRGDGIGHPATAPDPVAEARPADSPAPEASASLIAQAVAAAVDTCSLAIATLPQAGDPEFPERLALILSDVRQVEAIAVRATRISRITPELIRALSRVRRHYDQLMILGASAPGAPLGQRVYAARTRANLSTLETAQAAGVDENMVVRAEADEPVPAGAAAAIEALIGQLG